MSQPPAYASFNTNNANNANNGNNANAPAYLSGNNTQNQPTYATFTPSDNTPAYASMSSGNQSPSYVSGSSGVTSQTSNIASTASYATFSPTQPTPTPSSYATYTPTQVNPVSSYSTMAPSTNTNQLQRSASVPVTPVIDDGVIDPADFTWKFFVNSGTNLAPKDKNGKSDPFVVCELVTAKKSRDKWKSIKTMNKTKTSVVDSNLNPVWDFQAQTLNADTTWARYQGVKLSCWDKDLIGAPDFMGEAYLWFDEEIPGPSVLKKEIKVDLKSRPKKKDKISGYLTVTSLFERKNSAKPTDKKASRRMSQQIPGSNRNTTALNHSELVQISATGRREVKIPTSGVEKFISFGELPQFDTEVNLALQSKAERKYGFNTNVALWLVTSCTLAYKKEEIVQAVCLHVWDMCDFYFIDDKETDTQGFCMHNEEILVVCFRGTESIRDWMTNLNFVQVAASHFPERFIKAGVRVHNGFNEALKSVYNQVEAFVNKAYKRYPKLKLYVCGHSLGGALANLCFGYLVLSDNPRDVTGVYTIGQPRVGNKKFKEQLELVSPNTVYMRITNNQDCVPSLAGGQHCGTHIHFDALGGISYEPPIWKKAVQKAHSIHGSAKNMSYAGIADHSSPVYRKLIESHWVKEEFSQISNKDGSFNLCERILYLTDMLQEDVKAVRRYKIQFRALLANILNVRPIIMFIEDFLASGIDDGSRAKLKNCLLKFFELLSKTKKEVVARHSKKSILQSKNSKSSLKAFNSKMTTLAGNFQDCCDSIHNILQAAKSNPPKNLPSYASFFVPETPKYDSSAYNTLKFSDINFHELGIVKQEANMHVSQLIDAAESMIEEGKSEEALKVLVTLESGSDSTVGSLSPEDTALVSFLKAKAHAKLHHHQEAVQALSDVSGSGLMSSSMMQDAAFHTLKNSNEFNQAQAKWNVVSTPTVNTASSANLNKFEIHMLEDLFDDADDNGDNFLTTQEFTGLVNRLGGLENILDNIGWIDKPDPNSPEKHENVMRTKNAIFNDILRDFNLKYRNAVDLDQFLNLMARLM